MSSTGSESSTTQQIIDRHDRYMSINYGRFPVAITRGEGARLWDADGKEYLDLFAGFGGPLLGQCHPDLVDAVTEQARTLWFVGNLLHTDPQTRLAEQIATKGFGGRSFFCHSGADANEAAIKLSRLYGRANPGPGGPRYKVISAQKSFHGRSFAAMAATGQPKVSEGFDPLPPGFVHVPYNDLAAIREAIDAETVALLVEPIQGEGGVVVPDADYWAGLRALCDEHDLLLIADEVWTGGGRTGRYFGHQHWGVEPDMMTLAKGVGGGLPVGVMCAKPDLAELFDFRKRGTVAHATTLGGNCLSMAVSARIFEVLERDGLIEHAAELGEHAMGRLRALAEELGFIREVRGKGLFIGVEFDLENQHVTFADTRELVKKGLEHGVLVNGSQGNVLRLAPPLTISRDELDRGLDLVERLIRP